jgi:hypothetical protein
MRSFFFACEEHITQYALVFLEPDTTKQHESICLFSTENKTFWPVRNLQFPMSHEHPNSINWMLLHAPAKAKEATAKSMPRIMIAEKA